MFTFGLENFRRLKSVESIAVKPITILVGRNSSGKSSYLRSMALISQSISTPTSGPILWWGDLVDFGSFDNSVFKGSAKDKAISFKLGVDDVIVSYSRFSYNFIPNPSKGNALDVTVEITLRSNSLDDVIDGATYISSLKIILNQLDIDVEFTLGPSNEILDTQVCGSDRTEIFRSLGAQIERNTFFPSVQYESDVKTSFYSVHRGNSVIVPMMRSVLSRYAHGRTLNQTLDTYVHRLLEQGVYNRNEIKSTYHDATSSGYARIMRKISRLNDQKDQRELEILSVIYFMPAISTAISKSFKKLFSNLYYIGPARVRSERYYRQQDLSVSKISSDGTNFAMFLASLSPDDLSDFSQSVFDLYGYHVHVWRGNGPHISIFLEDHGFNTNLVDTGYGLSQILPVLAQVWWSKRTSKKDEYSIILIEQPELHLHPAHQARLADAFVSYSETGEGKSATSFIIETHSETMLNRFGELIYEKKLKSDDLQVLIFEDDPDLGEFTSVRISRFNDAGALVNWPFGFFSV